MALLLSSLLLWWQNKGSFGLPRENSPQAGPSRWAYSAAVGWVGFLLANELLAMGSAFLPGQPVESAAGAAFSAWQQVLIACGLEIGLLGILLPLVLFDRRHPSADIGVEIGPKVSWSDVSWALDQGAKTFLLAVFPTAMALILLAPIRPQTEQHPFLQLLAESPDPALIGMLAVAVGVLAPLAEELIFRVILQSGLGARWGPSRAWGTTAVLFALVHGWRDALALLPLALLLGASFERHRSYLAVCTTHGLFNLTMLLLALLTTKPAAAPL